MLTFFIYVYKQKMTKKKVIIDQENCFIACCTKFIQIKFQDPKQDIDWTRALTRNCFYFDNDVIVVNDNMRGTCKFQW